MKYHFKIICMSLLFSLLLCGCSKDEKLSSFEENMINFSENISRISLSIDSIDPSSEDAVSLMNTSLNELLEQFQILADMEIPSQFSSIEDLADDGLEYMQEAVRLYSQAFEEDYVNDSFIQAAGENYESAMKRVHYIATILQGEIPEGARIIEGNDNEFEPYTE